MRLLLIINCIFFFSILIRAQDTIIQRDGITVISKVLEVNEDNIRYKRFDLQDGPVYTLGKEKIDRVIYYNGIKEIYGQYVPPQPKVTAAVQDLTIQTSGKYYYYKDMRITEPDMHAIVKKVRDTKINAMVRSIENKKFAQDVTLYGSIPVFLSGLYVYETNRPVAARRGRTATSSSTSLQAQKNGIILMIAAVTCDLVSISFMLDRRRHNHLVVNAFNNYITKH